MRRRHPCSSADFSLAACGALALLLTAAESSQAQFFGSGRGAFFWPGLSYPVGPTYANYPHPFIYNPPPTSASGFQQYSADAPTQIYYGAATPMFYGNYSPGYSTVRGGLVSPPVGLTAASNVGEAAYATPSYPIQSPNYAVRYPASPSSAITDNTAEVVVRLPADAELWFEGQKTVQTGSDRPSARPTCRRARTTFTTSTPAGRPTASRSMRRARSRSTPATASSSTSPAREISAGDAEG